MAEPQQRTPLWKKSGVTAARSVTLLFAIPVLTVLSLGLAICSAVVLAGGLLKTFGWKELHMEMLPGMHLPYWLDLPVSLIFCALFLVLSLWSRKKLKFFLQCTK
ncbi:hypothetical protein [Fictibacillus fluitans]|uniref:Uncharacterized protein n=1 Tax=Fictibacillus fluitans TaxID=3058422 RepID=A0ABT8HTC3_9BACL|nr:hypothetical protein [Fictibacillus sp. NE201]MDN4524023.1 hypothetical protein [Fictibacillus sp. NE201]